MSDELESIGKELLQLKSPEGYLYAGIPNFKGLFGRDSIIAAWQLLSYDKNIAKATLASLAGLQGKKVDPDTGEEPGKILHEYYPVSTDQEWFKKYKSQIKWLKIGVPVYFSIDSTALFIILYCEYHKKYADIEFSKALLSSARAAADWIITYGMINKAVRYAKPSSFDKGLLSQSWKDGAGSMLNDAIGPVAAIEVQGYCYYALNSLADVMSQLEPKYNVNQLKGPAAAIASTIQGFWMPSKDYYAMGIEGTEKRIEKVTSNPGHLLFTGAVDKEHAGAIVRRLFAKDMFTQYGIRTHSSLESDFDERSYQRGSVWPHDNWIIAIGLKSMGYISEYIQIKNAILKAYVAMGCSPEYYGVKKGGALIKAKSMKQMPCIPQAWTAGAAISFLSS